MPNFYAERLRPSAKSLKKRKSLYRKWWELSRPVATWLAGRYPRIVSQEFGRAGNFAVDPSGEYAVVQGFGWCWKNGEPDLRTLHAYLSILNSQFFDQVMSAFCSRVKGGQYVFRRHFLEPIPLPSLEDRKLCNELAAIGRRMSSGTAYDKVAQEALVKAAYGLSSTGEPVVDPSRAMARLERRFRELADQWEETTEFYSRAERKIRHPLYREIIALGQEVVPLLLKDTRENPGYWSTALRQLTGENPVPAGADSLDAIALAWLEWGRKNGYEG